MPERWKPGDHQREELGRVHRVGAEPDDAAARLAQLRVPAREQPGLAVAGGRVEQHEPPSALRPQEVQQDRALGEFHPERRRRRVVLKADGLLGHGVVESTERGRMIARWTPTSTRCRASS